MVHRSVFSIAVFVVGLALLGGIGAVAAQDGTVVLETNGEKADTGMVDTDFEVTDVRPSTGENEAKVSYDDEDGTVTVNGTVIGRNMCETTELGSAEHDDTGSLRLNVVSHLDKRERELGCASVLTDIDYSLTVTFEGGLPEDTSVRHDGEEVTETSTEKRDGVSGFEVSIDSTNSPVTVGERVTVTGTVENIGDEPDTQRITATVSGFGPFTQTVSLKAGESRTKSISVPTTPGDAGTYTLKVESENDTSTETVKVEPDGVAEREAEGSPAEGVSDELWDAVTSEDGEQDLSLADLGSAIREYRESPEETNIDGMGFTLSDLGSLIQHYRDEAV